MAITIDGTSGVSGVDGGAATPAYRGGDADTGIFYPSAGVLGISTNGSERMRIDTSGNVGIGVTPAAWSYLFKALQVSNFGLMINAGNGNTYQLANAYYDGSYKYLTTAPALRYELVGGQHIWSYAASGTAGNTITFTEAMRIDTSGSVGIGTVPTQKLHVYTPSDCVVLSQVDTSGAAYFRAAYGSTVTIDVAADNGAGYLGSSSNHPIYIRTNNVARLAITNNGFSQFGSNTVMLYQGNITSKSTTATLSGAELITGILNTTGTSYTVTIPTGTDIEGALSWTGNNVCLDWWVINSASGTITIGANGNTSVGALTVAAATSAQFRIRRTAANTFTIYRLG